MKVEVVTPEEYMGDVMGDLNRRRGIVQGMEDSLPVKLFDAEVPLSRNVWLCNRFTFMLLKDEQHIRWNFQNMQKLQQILLKQLLRKQ